jgi:hypothetical protein
VNFAGVVPCKRVAFWGTLRRGVSGDRGGGLGGLLRGVCGSEPDIESKRKNYATLQINPKKEIRSTNLAQSVGSSCFSNTFRNRSFYRLLSDLMAYVSLPVALLLCRSPNACRRTR